MKALKISFLLIYSFFFSSICHAQWQKITTINKSWSIGSAIDACDSSTAVISVRSENFPRSILLTNNAGRTWKVLTWPSSNDYNEAVDISIYDSLHIWAGLDDGRIIATNDGGKTWNEQFHNSDLTNFINYLKMFNINDGIAMGDCRTYGSVKDIYFIDDLNGFASGYGISELNRWTTFFKKTTDGGLTWIPVTLPSNLYMDLIYPEKVQFINNSKGWILGSNIQLLRTTDGGSSWTETVFENTIRDFHFFDNEYGWATGTSVILRSTDRGITWIKNPQTFSNKFNSIYFSSRNTGWVAGSFQVLKTNDGGETWSLIQNFTSDNTKSGAIVQNSLRFIDDNTGFILINNSETNAGLVLKTSDGGATWSEKILVQNNSLSNIQLKKNSSGSGGSEYSIWITANTGKIFFSNDLGDNWNEISVPYPNNLEALYFTNKTTGFVGGYNGLILKTVDGGTNWQILNGKLPQPAVFLTTNDGGQSWISQNESNLLGFYSGDTWRRVDFLDNQNGYFYGPGSKSQRILKTDNGGKSWQETNFIGGLQLLKFYAQNLGFALIGNDNDGNFILSKTKDACSSWQTSTIHTSGWASDLEFLPGDPSKIWFSELQHLFFSSDTGKTWNISPVTASIRDIEFTDQNHGWILGDDSNLYRTNNNGGMITDVDENEQNSIPVSFELYQNYPNPFNPETTISWQLPQRAFVTLKIYDLLGREIVALVNEYQNAGIHNSQFATLNLGLSSGIYFYCLTAEDYVQTKKMLLIK